MESDRIFNPDDFLKQGCISCAHFKVIGIDLDSGDVFGETMRDGKMVITWAKDVDGCNRRVLTWEGKHRLLPPGFLGLVGDQG